MHPGAISNGPSPTAAPDGLSPPYLNRGLNGYVVITYPDMEGAAELGRIKLDPEKCNGHTERYSYRGWGLIAVQISNETKSLTRVAANTEKRANKLVGTHPEIMPPSTWQWGAVASHARRLQRVLKRVT